MPPSTITLKLRFATKVYNCIISTDRKELCDLQWSLHGHFRLCALFSFAELYVECQPVDSKLLLKCEAEVRFRHENFDYYSGCVRNLSIDTTTDKTMRTGNFTLKGPRWKMSDMFVVDIEIKSFELLYKYPFFDFKDHILSDIVLIVGDKKLYTSKKILAQQSKIFYKMIYGGDKEVDQIEIENVDWLIFSKFLAVLHGYDTLAIAKQEIEEFAELSIRFNAKRCLKYCGEQYKKYPNLLKIMEVGCKEGEKSFILNGIPFKTTRFFDGANGIERFSIECGLDDESEWRIVIIIELGFKTYSPIFTSKYRTWSSWGPNNRENMSLRIESCSRKFPEEIIDFSRPVDNLTDIVLSVDDKKFNVCRQILANSSTYFYSMFYSEFSEKHQTDIELIGIDKDEFEEFLQHVYNPKRSVEEYALENLLQLSQYYNALHLREKCIQFISSDSKISDERKLELSLQYDLETLATNTNRVDSPPLWRDAYLDDDYILKAIKDN